MQTTSLPVGNHLRQWRQRRRLSQLDLACTADISARHLSFVETGRAKPSREMILHLAEQLEIPVRERNVLLVAGGYAPIFAERALADEALAPARAAIDVVLAGLRPYPAFALDRHWNVVATNSALPVLYEGVDDALLAAPLNVLKLSLHPGGLAPRIANLGEWRAHLLQRLRRQIDLSADRRLVELEREVLAYPSRRDDAATAPADGIVVPLRIRTRAGLLSFLSTTMVFGTPLDITLSELAVESFFAADEETAATVRALAA